MYIYNADFIKLSHKMGFKQTTEASSSPYTVPVSV